MNAVALPCERRIRRTWARDIAQELLDRIHRRGMKHTLFVHADGHVDFMRGNCLLWKAWEASLVGVYDHSAQLADVTDDILAMQRESIDGKASG